MSRKSLGKIEVEDVFEVNGGTITVLEYIDRQKIFVKHNDEYSHCMWTRQDAIEKGMVKNPYHRSVEGVGYFGVGKFSARNGNEVSWEYAAWRSMIYRCYSTVFQDKHPSYVGCTVCEEWHNFQVFADWYTREDEYGRGYHLDKDVLVKGNKVYSPSTCCLVPQDINSFFCTSQEKESGLPVGISKTKYGTFQVKLSSKGMKKYVGTYKTLEEASYAYSNAKGIRAKELALENLGNIRYKVFLAIMNWKF